MFLEGFLLAACPTGYSTVASLEAWSKNQTLGSNSIIVIPGTPRLSWLIVRDISRFLKGGIRGRSSKIILRSAYTYSFLIN